MKSLTKNPKIYTAIEYGLYAGGGMLFFRNIQFTVDGFRANGTWQIDGYLLAFIIGGLSTAFTCFITSTELWGELWEELILTGRNAGKSESGLPIPRLLKALLLAVIAVFVLVIVGAAYYFDCKSTYDGLVLSGWQSPTYVILGTILFVFGTEVALPVGHRMGRMAKVRSIPHLQERNATEPQIVFLEETLKHNKKTARESAAATQGQYQHGGRGHV